MHVPRWALLPRLARAQRALATPHSFHIHRAAVFSRLWRGRSILTSIVSSWAAAVGHMISGGVSDSPVT